MYIIRLLAVWNFITMYRDKDIFNLELGLELVISN
jgi:hypothetical protein